MSFHSHSDPFRLALDTRPRLRSAKIILKRGSVLMARSASSPTDLRNCESTWNTIDPIRPKPAMPSPKRESATTASVAISSTSKFTAPRLPNNGKTSTPTTARLSDLNRTRRPQDCCLSSSSDQLKSDIYIVDQGKSNGVISDGKVEIWVGYYRKFICF